MAGKDSLIEKVHKSGLRFLTTLTLPETYSLIAREAMKLVKSDYVVILLRSEGRFVNVYSTNPLLSRPKPRSRGFTHQVFVTGKPVILSSKTLTRIHPEFKGAE